MLTQDDVHLLPIIRNEGIEFKLVDNVQQYFVTELVTFETLASVDKPMNYLQKLTTQMLSQLNAYYNTDNTVH